VAKKPAVPVQADDRAAAIESLIKGINSKARGAVVVRGAEAVTSPWMYLRRPVGIPSLDIALHGGVPAGGISRWWGEKSSGKDMLFWNAVRQQQAIAGDSAAVAMADTDTGIDKTQARMLGVILPYSDVEIRKLEEAQGEPFSPELLADLCARKGWFHEISAENSEVLLDTVIMLIESGLYSLISVNSLGSLTSSNALDEDSLGDNARVGYDAMLKTRFIKKANHYLKSESKLGTLNTTHLWLIDQVRSKIGASQYEDPLKPTGGATVDHLIMLDVKVEAGAKIREKVHGEDTIVGRKTRCLIRKQKSGAHEGVSVSFNYYHHGTHRGAGVDVFEDLVACGIQYHLVNQAGPWLTYQDIKMQGVENFANHLRVNPEQFVEMQRAVYKAAGINCLYA